MGGLTVKVVALERNHKITRHFITAPGLLVENHFADRHFADTQILKVGMSTKPNLRRRPNCVGELSVGELSVGEVVFGRKAGRHSFEGGAHLKYRLLKKEILSFFSNLEKLCLLFQWLGHSYIFAIKNYNRPLFNEASMRGISHKWRRDIERSDPQQNGT